MNFDFDFFLNSLIPIAKATDITMTLSLLSLLFSLILGTVVALSGFYKVKILNPICKIYVSIFRGTPLFTQMFLIYFGLPHLIPAFSNMDSFTAGVISISLNMGAYMSETIRASILSIDKGQFEAGYAIGMTNTQIMKRVVFPQAIRIALPPLSNNFIDIIKGSSIAFAIGVPEIMAQAKMAGALKYNYFEVYIAAMIVYWVIITALTYLQGKMEEKLSRAY